MMQEIPKAMIAEVLCDLAEKMKVRHACPFGDKKRDDVADGLAIRCGEGDGRDRSNIEDHRLVHVLNLSVWNRAPFAQRGGAERLA